VANSYWGRFTPYLFDDVDIEDQTTLAEHIESSLESLFQTPDVGSMTKTVIDGSPIYEDGAGLPLPLAFNENLYESGGWVTINQLDDPGTVIYATFGYEFCDMTDGSEYAKRPASEETPDNHIYYLDSRKALVIFVDGRVDYLTPPMMELNFE